MNFSYRGVTYLPSSESLVPLQSGYLSVPPFKSGNLGHSLGRRFTRFIAALSRFVITALQSISQQAIAASQRPMHFFKSHPAVSASSEFFAGEGNALQEERYAIERRLQLAYAVGNRQQIRMLEANLEAITGVRFSRQRAWLEQ